MEMAQYGDSVCNTVEENFNVFFPNPNVLVAVSKGMWAIKLLQQNLLVLGCRMTCICLFL